MIPEKYGGSGAGPVELAVACEEMGRALLCAPFFATAVLAARALLAAGDQAAADEYLPAIADGTTIATLAGCEDDGAWTTERLATRARRSGDGYRLDGRKSFVLDGHVADLLLVVAQADGGPSLFAVDAGASGLARRRWTPWTRPASRPCWIWTRCPRGSSAPRAAPPRPGRRRCGWP